MLSLCFIEVGQWPDGFVVSNPTSLHRLTVIDDRGRLCHVTETPRHQKPGDISKTDDSNDALDDSDKRTTALTSNSGQALGKTLGGLINAGARTVAPFRCSPSCSSISVELYGTAGRHDSFRLCQVSGDPSVTSDVMTDTATRNDSDATDDASSHCEATDDSSETEVAA